MRSQGHIADGLPDALGVVLLDLVALGKLEKDLATAKGKAKDVATVAHLGDLEAEIKKILSEEKK